MKRIIIKALLVIMVTASSMQMALGVSADTGKSIVSGNDGTVKDEITTTQNEDQQKQQRDNINNTVKNASPVSVGLNVIAEQNDIAAAGIVGNELGFSSEMFARAMNLSKVNSITVTSLPPVGEGALYLGSVGVTVGQTISGKDISMLNFSSGSNERVSSSFKVSVNESSYDLKCNVYLIDEINNTPTTSLASLVSLNIRTHRDTCAYGVVSANDAEGDELTYEIVKYPANGTLKLNDKHTGAYTYMPVKGYVGNDSFTYVARDKYGNYSKSADVMIKVDEKRMGDVFSDMSGDMYENAALYMAEKGLMNGTQIGTLNCFSPEKNVSRGEFLCLAMNASGVTDIQSGESTVFADNDEIPKVMRGYVAKAYTAGIISGTAVNGALYFKPDESISISEASVILSNIIGYSREKATPVFADMDSVPSYAENAVISLYNLGIIESRDGSVYPVQKLTRGRCAEMLAKVLQYREK